MSKPAPDLSSILAPKGGGRPDSIPQRALTPVAPPPAPAPAPVPTPVPVTKVKAEPRSKSLTLRLTETKYQALRRYSFQTEMTHQDVLELALDQLLERFEKEPSGQGSP